MNQSSLNVALVGCGNWGKNLIRVFSQLGVLGAVCDINPTQAKLFSEQYQVPAHTFEHLLSATDIHALVLASPSVTHEALATRCLEAGKHVFIEKPFTVQVSGAQQLVALAQKQHCTLMVGHLLQYHPVFIALKALVAKGNLGELQSISSTRCNLGKFPGEKSVLWDFAPHDISMILALMGEAPHQLTTTGDNFLAHTELDSVSLHLQFTGNRSARIFASWLHPQKEQKLIVMGSQGIAVFDDTQPWESKLRIQTYPSTWSDGLPQPIVFQFDNYPVEKSEPLVNECQHFIDSINHHQKPLTDGQEALAVMKVLAWAQQQLVPEIIRNPAHA